MKFNQYTWNLYKQSPEGQKAIKEFEKASENLSEFDLMFKYNPRLELWDDNKKRRSFIEDFMESMWCYNISEFPDEPTPQTLKEAKEKFEDTIFRGLWVNGEVIIPVKDYETMLMTIVWTSLPLLRATQDSRHIRYRTTHHSQETRLQGEVYVLLGTMRNVLSIQNRK